MTDEEWVELTDKVFNAIPSYGATARGIAKRLDMKVDDIRPHINKMSEQGLLYVIVHDETHVMYRQG